MNENNPRFPALIDRGIDTVPGSLDCPSLDPKKNKQIKKNKMN